MEPLDNPDPAKVRDFWQGVVQEGLSKVYRCERAGSLGVTDDHPVIPLLVWVSRARAEACPGFVDWWEKLPQKPECTPGS